MTNTLSVSQIEKAIRAGIDRENNGILIHETIASILKAKWNGKRINRRIVEQVKTALASKFGKEPVVYYDELAGMTNLRIWSYPGHETSDKSDSFFLGYSGRLGTNDLAAYPSEVFEERDACHGNAAKERNAKREKALKGSVSKWADTVNAFVKAKREFDNISSYDFPDWYNLQRLAGLLND